MSAFDRQGSSASPAAWNSVGMTRHTGERVGVWTTLTTTDQVVASVSVPWSRTSPAVVRLVTGTMSSWTPTTAMIASVRPVMARATVAVTDASARRSSSAHIRRLGRSRPFGRCADGHCGWDWASGGPVTVIQQRSAMSR